jgi:hypothetical protein
MVEKSSALVIPYVPDPGQGPKSNLHEDGSGVDPLYQAKSRILNRTIQDIGMGRYQVKFTSFALCQNSANPSFWQWYLFAVAGFGWFAYVIS